MPERPVIGRSVVTRRAIIDIVRSAVQSSYGVIGLSDPDLSSRFLRWLGLAERGIRLNRHEGLALDLYLTVAYGVPVAEVARQVDSTVRYALRHALAREVDRLTIHIDGLRYQPGPPPHPAGAARGAVEQPAAAGGIPAATAVAARSGATSATGANGSSPVAATGRRRGRSRSRPEPG